MMRLHFYARHGRHVAGFAVMLCALSGCGSADPTLFTLQPVPGSAVAGGPRVIELRRPGLAGYLDRSDIVLTGASYQLNLTSQSRWAEPLSDMVGRVLSQDLAQRLPGTSVFTQSGAITADPEARVEADIQRFDADAAGHVTLIAEIAIERGHEHTPVVSRHVDIGLDAGGAGVAAHVAAMSDLLGTLADRVAEDVRLIKTP